MNYIIREIQKQDNEKVESVIRSCLIEFGANHEGTAWADHDLGRFYQLYQAEGSGYWVATDPDGHLVGGAGIGPIPGAPGVCELQKMYLLSEARGTGLAQRLMEVCLAFARKCGYESCYLETLENMVAAQKLYEQFGFMRVAEPPAKTAHFACDVRYSKSLKTE